MKKLEKLAVRLSLTKAEILMISTLLGFLVLGGILKSVQSVEQRDLLIKKAVDARYREAEVDSLLKIAAVEQATVRQDVLQGVAAEERDGDAPPQKRGERSRTEKKVFTGTMAFNRASRQQLQQIPGIGPVMAERLVTFRAAKGGKVTRFEEFLEVKGIGKKKLEFLKQHFTLE